MTTFKLIWVAAVDYEEICNNVGIFWSKNFL